MGGGLRFARTSCGVALGFRHRLDGGRNNAKIMPNNTMILFMISFKPSAIKFRQQFQDTVHSSSVNRCPA
jgi:hypothetical protein